MRVAEKRTLAPRKARVEQLPLPFDSPRERLRRRLRPLLDDGMVLVDNSNGVNLFSFERLAGPTPRQKASLPTSIEPRHGAGKRTRK